MALEAIPEYDSGGVSEHGDHAVVVGGSMAGLVAARVLADGFGSVTVIERDSLPEEPAYRRGVPQARHAHVLQEAGRATLEDLFPGYSEDLQSAGAVVLDMASDFYFYNEGGFHAHGEESKPGYFATRPLLEHVTRRRLDDFDGVLIRDECQFVEFLGDDGMTSVDGAAIRNEGSEREEIAADIVVDATGRTSKTPTWLGDHGYQAPSVDEVTIDLAYSTVQINRPSDRQRAYLVMPCPPRKRGVGMFPIENGRWLVTFGGMHGDHPPTDEGDLADFAATLPVPEIERAITRQDIVSEGVDHYPFPSNLRRRYWELDRFPEGLVVIGDAVASFNPIYGQGMSVATLEALQLHHALATKGRDNLAPRFFDRIETVVEDAWSLSVGSDFRFPETTGPKPPGTDLLNRYFSRCHRKAHTDSKLSATFGEVAMMEKRPTALLRPGAIWRTLRPSLRRRESAH